jgi:hypothetical protein
MPFITDEQLKQQQIIPSPQIQDNSGVLQGIGQSLQNRSGQFKDIFSETASGKISPLETGVRAVGTTIGAGTDVLGEIIAPIIRPAIEKIVQTDAGKDMAYALKSGMDTYNEWKNSSPGAKRAAKDLESIVNIASVIPATMSGQLAGKGAIKSAQLTGKALSPVGEGVAVAGRVVEKAGDVLHGATPAFKPGIGQARQLVKEGAKTTILQEAKDVLTGTVKEGIQTVAKTARKYNLTGLNEFQLAKNAERVRSKLWDNTVLPAIKNIKDEVYIGDVFKKVATKFQQVSDPTELRELRDGLKAVFEDYQKYGRMTYEKADSLKSSLAKKVPQKVWNGKDVTGVTNQIRYEMSNELRDMIAKKLPKQVKEAYYDYGNLKTIIDRGASSLTKAYQEGGFGKVVGQVLKTVETPITTYGGKAIQKTGQLLQKVKQAK